MITNGCIVSLEKFGLIVEVERSGWVSSSNLYLVE